MCGWGVLAVVTASAVSVTLPLIHKDTFVHDSVWLLMHPIWGLGFFILVNRVVQAEGSWLRFPAATPGHGLRIRWGFFLFAIPHARAGDHAIVVVHHPSVTTHAEHAVYCDTRNSNLCLAVLPVLREALYEKEGRNRGQEQEQDEEAPIEPTVLAIK